MVALLGANTDSERAKLRGRSYPLIIIDEGQAFGQFLHKYITEDIRPTLRNVQGTLIVQGTPPASLAHPFYTQVWLNPVFQRFTWNITHWPKALYKKLFGQTAEKALAQDLKDRGVNSDDVTFRREMLGELLADENSIAYRYSKERNHFEILPSYTHCVFGIDIGYRDATSISVLIFDERLGTIYLAYEYIATEMTTQEIAEVLKPLAETWKPFQIAIDSVGNRIAAESIKQQLGSWGVHLPIEPRKVLPVAAQVDMVNSALKSSRLMVKADSQAAQDMGVVTWKNGVHGSKLDGVHSDAIPSLCYAVQLALPILPPPPAAIDPNPRYQDRPSVKATREKAEKALKANKPWWEQGLAIEDDTDPFGNE
jgi:hypothetical protein